MPEFQCSKCDYKSNRKANVVRHEMTKHSEEKKAVEKVHKCDKCDYSTDRAFNLKKHIEAKHTEEAITKQIIKSRPKLLIEIVRYNGRRKFIKDRIKCLEYFYKDTKNNIVTIEKDFYQIENKRKQGKNGYYVVDRDFISDCHLLAKLKGLTDSDQVYNVLIEVNREYYDKIKELWKTYSDLD